MPGDLAKSDAWTVEITVLSQRRASHRERDLAKEDVIGIRGLAASDFAPMDTPAAAAQEVDLHRLELRFAQVRVLEPRCGRAAGALDRAMRPARRLRRGARAGEPTPGPGRRLPARGGAAPTAGATPRGSNPGRCDLAQALLSVLARAHGRAFAALEEALLLRELVHGQGLSQHEVARRCGRDVSWVSRRLQLLLRSARAACSRRVAQRHAVHLGGHPRAGPVGARQRRARRSNCSRALQCDPAVHPRAPALVRSTTRAARATPASAWSRTRSCSSQSLHARDEQRAVAALARGPRRRGVAADVSQLLRLITRLRARSARAWPAGVARTALARWRFEPPAQRASTALHMRTSGGTAIMTPIEIRNSVRTLQAQGHSLREISRLLELSRNTVRRILRAPSRPRTARRLPGPPAGRALQSSFRARPRQRRAHAATARRRARPGALLQHAHPLGATRRSCAPRPSAPGEYHFAPGQEMQHDTSPHRVSIGAKTLTAQCAGSGAGLLAPPVRAVLPTLSRASKPSTSCSRPRASWTGRVRCA